MGTSVPIDSQVRIANCRYIEIGLFIHDDQANGVVSFGRRVEGLSVYRLQ